MPLFLYLTSQQTFITQFRAFKYDILFKFTVKFIINILYKYTWMYYIHWYIT